MNIRIAHGLAVHSQAADSTQGLRVARCGANSRGQANYTHWSVTSDDVTCKSCLKRLAADALTEEMTTDAVETIKNRAAAESPRPPVEQPEHVAEAEARRITGIYASMVRLTDHELQEIPANAEFHVRAAAADEQRRRKAKEQAEQDSDAESHAALQAQVSRRVDEPHAFRTSHPTADICDVCRARRANPIHNSHRVADASPVVDRPIWPVHAFKENRVTGMCQICRTRPRGAVHAVVHSFEGPFQGCTRIGCDLPRESPLHQVEVTVDRDSRDYQVGLYGKPLEAFTNVELRQLYDNVHPDRPEFRRGLTDEMERRSARAARDKEESRRGAEINAAARERSRRILDPVIAAASSQAADWADYHDIAPKLHQFQGELTGGAPCHQCGQLPTSSVHVAAESAHGQHLVGTESHPGTDPKDCLVCLRAAVDDLAIMLRTAARNDRALLGPWACGLVDTMLATLNHHGVD